MFPDAIIAVAYIPCERCGSSMKEHERHLVTICEPLALLIWYICDKCNSKREYLFHECYGGKLWSLIRVKIQRKKEDLSIFSYPVFDDLSNNQKTMKDVEPYTGKVS